jgi:hypothetical protein
VNQPQLFLAKLLMIILKLSGRCLAGRIIVSVRSIEHFFGPHPERSNRRELMIFSCPRVKANFPTEDLCLKSAAARLVWDEHGGTFVLRVEGLELLEPVEPRGETGIWLEVALPEPGTLSRSLAGFAAEHDLRLEPAAAGAELAESPLLAACHVPGKNLFIFCEDPHLCMRLNEAKNLEIRVSGVFKSRRVPSQEADIIIHLSLASMTRLLAGLLALSR